MPVVIFLVILYCLIPTAQQKIGGENGGKGKTRDQVRYCWNHRKRRWSFGSCWLCMLINPSQRKSTELYFQEERSPPASHTCRDVVESLSWYLMHCSRLLMSKYTSWECRIRTAVGFPLVLKTFQIYTFLISIILCFIRSTNIFFPSWSPNGQIFTAIREKPWNTENRKFTWECRALTYIYFSHCEKHLNNSLTFITAHLFEIIETETLKEITFR